jgi:hypothetical protein
MGLLVLHGPRESCAAALAFVVVCPVVTVVGMVLVMVIVVSCLAL